jgi:GNAT superfamily N-acetyltransferase
VEVQAADRLSPARLAEVFNAGFSDYAVALQLDEAALREHVHSNDIDLAWSRVAICERPVALALIAHRGAEAWVGGMGTAPTHRRRGIGEQVLVEGLAAARSHGCQAAWLEVLADNERAIRLYEKLGFQPERMLTVWSRDPAPAVAGEPSRPVTATLARAWIAAHRADREPWQRADASLDRMQETGAELQAQAVERAGKTAAAVVYRGRPDAVTVLALAATDIEAAVAVLTPIASGRTLRLSNLPADSPLSPALEHLGAEPVVRQLEMRLTLS